VYLVDTSVVSAGAAARLAPAGLVAWMDAHSALLFLSVVTVAEIEDGIAKLRRSDVRAAWLETVLHLYGDRILAFDTPTARIASALSDQARGPRSSAGIRRYHCSNGAEARLDGPVAQRPPFCSSRPTGARSVHCLAVGVKYTALS
jgi:predicted nucleic acid-binding protein